MIIRQGMEAKLRAALQPEQMDIIDESQRHASHGGGHPDGESHFRMRIVAAAFAGKSRVARHRLVHEILADELRERVHALSLETLTPEEAAAAA